jgi:hypothetical protein
MKELKIQSVGDLDPAVIEALRIKLQAAAADCVDRPALKKARKVTLTMSFVPIMQPNGDASTVRRASVVKGNVPDQVSQEHILAVRRNGFAFNPDSPNNPNQLTLIDEDEDVV